jgi:hypothetical protein
VLVVNAIALYRWCNSAALSVANLSGSLTKCAGANDTAPAQDLRDIQGVCCWRKTNNLKDHWPSGQCKASGSYQPI